MQKNLPGLTKPGVRFEHVGDKRFAHFSLEIELLEVRVHQVVCHATLLSSPKGQGRENP